MHAATGFWEALEPRKGVGKLQGGAVEGGKFKGVAKSRFQLQMHFGQEIMLQVEFGFSLFGFGFGYYLGGGAKYQLFGVGDHW